MTAQHNASLRLARLFTPAFARAINSQLISPATSQVVKPNALESALARPLQKAHYQPESSPTDLAASLSYGIIKGRLSYQYIINLCCPEHPSVHRTSVLRRQQANWCVKHTELDHDHASHTIFAAFFLANEYLRAQGVPGLVDERETGEICRLAKRYVGVASGQLDEDGLLSGKNGDRN